MIAKKKKKRKYEKLISWFFIVLIMGILGFLFYSNYKINKKRAELLNQIENLEKEIWILEEQTFDLQAGISEADKESYWEEKAREQGFVREGEQPVVIVPSKEEEKENQNTEEKGFFEGLIDRFRDFLRE
jgi:cell division protein FtsB